MLLLQKQLMRMNSLFRMKFLFLHLDVEVEVEVGVEAGHGQARVFTLTPQDVQTSNVVVAGTLSVCSCEARVFFDPGASHSFISSTLLREWHGKHLKCCFLCLWRLHLLMSWKQTSSFHLFCVGRG